MLPIVLVLLVVTSVIAAPTVSLTQYSANEIPRARDNGKASFLTQRAFDLLDGGDTTPNVLTAEVILNDIANLSDRKSQALALSSAIAILGLEATGSPGDACSAASLVDAYVNAVRSGNPASVRPALIFYIERLANDLGLIERLALNPESLRYAVGPQVGCRGEGRAYQLDAAWDLILDNADSNVYSFLYEESCTVKRLHNAIDKRSNNIGSALTALALPPTVQVFNIALGPVTNLFRAIANGGNIGAAAASARTALRDALGRVKY